ncbi:MAG: 4Fe-4S dicluster domain-containing protein [Candidatus Bathyarchaeia archaeon]
MESLNLELKGMMEILGLDILGVADLRPASDFIKAQGGEHLTSYPLAVSLGMKLIDAVVDELHLHEKPSAIFSYRGLYNSVNQNLDRASLLIARRLQREGFRAYPIPASQIIDPRRLEGAFSHKLAAYLAGLGWIGKNCLLITPEYGPRVRLATVLTDAPLEAGRPIPDGCGDCRRCVEACPVGAITGRPFNPKEARDLRLRAHLCSEYSEKRARLIGEGLCGLCVYICPYGKRKTQDL